MSRPNRAVVVFGLLCMITAGEGPSCLEKQARTAEEPNKETNK